MTGTARLILVSLSLGMVPAEGADPPRKAEALLANERPLVIAHRGFSAAAPENTIPSFRLALTAAADLVELDYHLSADGVPIVIHDADLDRATDAVKRWGGAKIRADSKRADELRGLDAGSWFDPRFAGTRLPLLTEALDAIQASGVTLIERKAGPAAGCVELLRKRGLVNEVVVQAFDWAYLRDFHSLEPDQVLGALGPPNARDGRELTDEEKRLDSKRIEEARGTGARLVVWNKLVDRAAVGEAHRRKLKVWIYTVNDPVLAGQMLDLGADGIITDNPALIWKTIAVRGMERTKR